MMFEAVDAQEMRVEVCTILARQWNFYKILLFHNNHRYFSAHRAPMKPNTEYRIGAKCYRVQNKNDAHYTFVAHVVQWLVCSTWKLDGSGSILDLDLFFFLFFSFFFFFFSSILGGAIFLSKLKYDRVISNVLQCSSRRTWWKCRLHVTLMI